MDVAQIVQFFNAIGCVVPKPPTSKWVNVSCPLAPWRHQGGRDEHPSFGIAIMPGAMSYCYCFACHYSAELSVLVWALAARTGRDYEAAFRLICRYNQPSQEDLDKHIGSDDKDDTPLSRLKRRILKATYAFNSEPPRELIQPVECVEIPEGPFLEETQLDGLKDLPRPAIDYLVGPERRLTRETIQTWELGYNRGNQRIVIPIRDRENRLVGLSGRSISGGVPKYLHSTGFRRDFYLYGEDKVLIGGTGILVEGFFDVQWLYQLGYRSPIAVLGTHLSKWQADKIVKYFTSLTIFMDGDRAGIEAADRIQRTLEGRIPMDRVTDPEGQDPNEMDPGKVEELLGPPQLEKKMG